MLWKKGKWREAKGKARHELKGREGEALSSHFLLSFLSFVRSFKSLESN